MLKICARVSPSGVEVHAMVALGAVVLPESVHEATMEELERRHGGN